MVRGAARHFWRYGAICVVLTYVLVSAMIIFNDSRCLLGEYQPSIPDGVGVGARRSRGHVPLQNRHRMLAEASNLIIVAGHAILKTPLNAKTNLMDESAWILESFQRDQVAAFVSHVKAGVDLLSQDSSSLLMFSGGQTRAGSLLSEATSYSLVAEQEQWFGLQNVRNRTFAEEFARDSFENVLFSLCRFKEVTGRYPANITVVSLSPKEKRFWFALHDTLKFPAERIRFIGIGPDNITTQFLQSEEQTVEQWRNDPFGCSGPLRKKRDSRNPFFKTVPYFGDTSCRDLNQWGQHCNQLDRGTKLLRGRKFPWE